MMLEKGNCSVCSYWQKQPDPEDGTEMGICRRFPPSYDGWPMTMPVDWCGEWNATVDD